MSSETAHVLFLFLDGVGLGKADADTNPLVAAHLPVLTGLAGGRLTQELAPHADGGALFRHLDATLGVEGLPQSATGQTTLLTGLNGAATMQRHYGPWPGPTLLALLQQGTLFHDAQQLDGAVLANAYPDDYFAAIDTRSFKPNAPVVAARSAGLELRDMSCYRAGQAVAADLSGRRFSQMAANTLPQSPQEAAKALSYMSRQASLTFFDLWLTDALGHAQNRPGAVDLLERLDALVGALLNEGAGEEFTLLITSDHGNLEDLTTKGHTMSRVPLLVVSDRAEEFAQAGSLVDVAPAVRRLWQR